MPVSPTSTDSYYHSHYLLPTTSLLVYYYYYYFPSYIRRYLYYYYRTLTAAIILDRTSSITAPPTGRITDRAYEWTLPSDRTTALRIATAEEEDFA